MNNFLKKSKLLDIKDRDILFLCISLTAIIFSVCLVVGLNFIDDINYNGKILSELNNTNKTLIKNAKEAKKLNDKIEQLNNNEDLQKLQISDKTTPLQVILDSMPANYNTVSWQSSLKENVFDKSSVSIVSLSVINQSTEVITTKENEDMKPVNWSATLSDDTHGLQSAIKDLERTIRPIIVDNIHWDVGTSMSANQMTINASTFYAPLINYTLGYKVVPR